MPFNESQTERIQSPIDSLGANPSPAALSALSTEDRNAVIANLRAQSRLRYIDDREKQQINLHRTQLAEEEKVFEDIRLSEREVKLRELNLKIAALAKTDRSEFAPRQLYTLPIDAEESDKKGKPPFQCKVDEEYEDGKQIWDIKQAKRVKDICSFDAKVLRAPKVVNKEQSKRAEMHFDRDGLPVTKYKENILQILSQSQTLILVGETGSGKTTQIPQFLLAAGYGLSGAIVVTQPRRVAAITVAARVAAETGTPLGSVVGYSVRFEEKIGPETKIKFLTDGILLREFMDNPTQENVSVIILDEAHERTLNTDLLFGLLKDLVRARSDLRLMITSATLRAQKFSEYFDNAPVLNIPGKQFPIEIYYSQSPQEDYVEAAIVTALQIHMTQPLGDILIFLTGEQDIEAAVSALALRGKQLPKRCGALMPIALHGSLSTDQQALAFIAAPKNTRKAIVATNIAETSITIPNICFVVDAGLAKQTSFNPRNGVETLGAAPISRAAADQRAGRAGRTQPGMCFRLYTLATFQQELAEHQIPEIQRCDLTAAILHLKSIGIDNFVQFDFMDPPHYEFIARALDNLFVYNAFDEKGDLTPIGRRLTEFPLHPALGRTILEAEHNDCVEQVLTIVSMLSCGQNVFARPKDRTAEADRAKKRFVCADGDHLSLLRAFEEWANAGFSDYFARDNFLHARALRRARDILEQLKRICEHIGIDCTRSTTKSISLSVKRAFIKGFFTNVARRTTKLEYRLLRGDALVSIHPSSCLASVRPTLVFFHEMVLTSKEYMRCVSVIDCKTLKDCCGQYYTEDEFKEC